MTQDCGTLISKIACINCVHVITSVLKFFSDTSPVRRNTAPDRTGPHQTAPGPPKLEEGTPQPRNTMGSPGTLPLWVGIRNSAKGYRSYSMTQALLELNLSSFDTLLFNSSARFLHRWRNCNNDVVKHLSAAEMYVGPFFKIQSNPIHLITDPIQSKPP